MLVFKNPPKSLPFIRYNQNLKDIAKQLRKNQTPAETEMWEFLKINFPRVKFLRQKPLDNFIPDFYSIKYKLIIEIDGEIHNKQREKDKERDNLFCAKYGITTIRFSNEEVFNKKKMLFEKLEKLLH